MLEITADHIAELADDDLRELIGLLCEAELAKRGLPVSAVTYGGDQRAGDGGVDVRVALPEEAGAGDFVPRPNTGFQVKRQDMPRKAILREMRPAGKVRTAIRELADASGAYVIACSQGSTSHSRLHDRRAAMKDALAVLPNAADLAVEFYDRTRLASWVRQHVGLIPWVRTKIGKPLRGWQAYGPWAYEPEGTKAEFLVDDTLRIQTRQSNDGAGLSVAAGIEGTRAILREPGSIVRLVGLSGVGKTRLVQALFDARVGAQPLDKAQALYTNMSDDPDPQPVGMVSDLLASRSRAVVVVDNCGSELHRRLSEVCRVQGSTLSVITIEYDIQDDKPEGTEVFELLPSSVGLIEQLLRRRFPQVSTVDAHTVAEFSGGNARIAIALAATAEKGGSLSRLRERELFERLFQQRQGHDAGLLQAAQACALVYSFDVETLDSDSAELPRLAALAGTDVASLYRSVAELLRRGLAQQRGQWRAVLPHALANPLAAVALQDLPLAAIEAQLIKGASERLLRSFSRRLGYLDSSPQAVRIARGWLEPNGLLGDTGNLNHLGRSMLMNIAPVVPEATVAALERATASAEIIWANDAVYLLRSLAWDANLFERSISLLAKIANGETKTDADNALTELFQLCFSGTHAPLEQRIRIAEGYLRADSEALRRIGLLALGGLLEGQLRSGFLVQFGGRSRDFGYWPGTGDEVRQWFDAGFELARRATAEGWAVASEVRRLMAKRFRGLWTRMAVYNGLEAISRFINEHGYWSEGWVATRETLRFDHAALSEEGRNRLIALERDLRPRDTVEKVHAAVFGARFTLVDFEDFAPDREERAESISGYQRIEEIARGLGEAVAVDETAFNELLPGLVTGQGQFFSFGRGLALASEKPTALWKRLVGQLALTAQGKRNTQVLGGFIGALYQRDPGLVGTLLDAAIDDETLAPWFVALQTSVRVDDRGFDRLIRALEGGRTPIGAFGHLSAWATDPIPGAKLRSLVSAIAERDGGYDAAFNILFMRLHCDHDQHRPDDPELAAAGRDLLTHLPFDHDDRDDGYKFRLVTKVALTGPEGADTARLVWRNFVAAVARQETYAFEQQGLLKALFSTQPAVLLDEIAAGDDNTTRKMFRLLRDAGRVDGNPVDAISAERVVAWCRASPATRFRQAAAIITPVTGGADGAAAQWTPAAQALLEEAPDRVAVLDKLLTRFRPEGWTGSLAAILDSRAALLLGLGEHHDRHLAKHAVRAHEELQLQIATERQWETREHRSRDERFE
jgi:hypothetical protein